MKEQIVIVEAIARVIKRCQGRGLCDIENITTAINVELSNYDLSETFIRALAPSREAFDEWLATAGRGAGELSTDEIIELTRSEVEGPPTAYWREGRDF